MHKNTGGDTMKRTIAIIAVLLPIAIVVILLITQNMDNTYSDNQEDKNTMVEKTDHNLHFTLEEIDKKNNADGTNFKYTITNEGDKEQKLSFTTSQRYEYEISNKNEEVIHKYADGMAFMQVLKDVAISPGEALSYDITTPQLDEGAYTLTIFSVAQNKRETSKLSINFLE